VSASASKSDVEPRDQGLRGRLNLPQDPLSAIGRDDVVSLKRCKSRAKSVTHAKLQLRATDLDAQVHRSCVHLA
jgi:hypothetical protein